MRDALMKIADIMKYNYGRQPEKLADITQIALDAIESEDSKTAQQRVEETWKAHLRALTDLAAEEGLQAAIKSSWATSLATKLMAQRYSEKLLGYKVDVDQLTPAEKALAFGFGFTIIAAGLIGSAYLLLKMTGGA